MIVVAGPPGSGKTSSFPVTAFGVDAFNIDDRCAQILGSYRAIRTKLPWFHLCVLLEKVKGPSEREWYLHATIQHGWSRNGLRLRGRRACGLGRRVPLKGCS